jgi:hypothetical protein
MNNEQAVLDAFERGKAFGFAEGMKSMRPVNSVLVPCDKLKEMQEKLTKYELRNKEQRNRIAHLEAKLSEALDAENDRRFE